MTTANVGIRSGNVIVPYVSVTKRTKTIDLTISDGTNLTSTSTKRAKAIFTADSNGQWWIDFNATFTATLASATSWDFTIAGITFLAVTGTNGNDANVNVRDDAFIVTGTRAVTGQSIIAFYSTATRSGSKEIMTSGFIPLASEPVWATLGTTAAAALEGVLAADVYIAPASASASGIVDTQAQSFKGPKTFIDGIVLGSGNETLSVYDEGTWTPGYNSSSNLLDSSGGTLSNTDITWGNSTYTRIGNRVFVTLATIAGLKINLINADTALVINATLLPTPNANAQLSGCASCYLPSPNYEKINVQISGNGSTITLNIQSHSPVEAGDILTLFGLSFTYFI